MGLRNWSSTASSTTYTGRMNRQVKREAYCPASDLLSAKSLEIRGYILSILVNMMIISPTANRPKGICNGCICNLSAAAQGSRHIEQKDQPQAHGYGGPENPRAGFSPVMASEWSKRFVHYIQSGKWGQSDISHVINNQIFTYPRSS